MTMLFYAQQDSDSGGSSLNASREDLFVSVKPPPFDSIYASDAYPASSPSSSPLLTTVESRPRTSLPGYSDSLPVPGYRPNPTQDERRLEFVPSRSVRRRDVAVWTKRIKDMTISLNGQDPIEIQREPRYGRRGIIRGTIRFDEGNLANFEKVKLVIEGQTSIGNNIHEGRSEIFVRKSITIWKLENSAPCPQTIPFQIPFSAIASKRMGIESLPPSYVFDLGQGGRIACSYSMHIDVVQKSKHGFWTNRNRHVIPINYVPKSRPVHTFPRDLVSPLSTIKACPEVWKQIITHREAMICNLFIPSVSSFCVTDEIPFFLQFVAPAGYVNPREGEEPRLQVSLQRQVGVSIQEVFIWRDTTSSQGVVEALPSGTIPRPNSDAPKSEAAVSSSSSGESMLTRGFRRNRTIKGTRGERVENGEMKTWEWKGTVCNNGINVGGCSTDVMVIRDFFVFSVRIKKANGHTLGFSQAQPIEMVSEMM